MSGTDPGHGARPGAPAPEETAPAGPGVFDLGDLPLLRGETLERGRLAYAVRGTLSADGRNAILCPSYFGGDHTVYDWLIGDGRPLDTNRYCVITVGLFGNGASSSPGEGPPRAAFPRITPQDNVAAQHRLLTEELGVTELALVMGWSMGAVHAYQWAVSHPAMVRRIAPVCGSAVTSEHSRVLLEGLVAALRADGGGEKGLRAIGRVYAGWATSHRFWADGLYQGLGFASREEYLVGFWEEFFVTRSSEDLLSMLWTWLHADVGASADGVRAALASVTARALLLPGAQDYCFPVAEAERAARGMPDAVVRAIPGVWGHMAGSGGNEADREFIGRSIADLLADRVDPAAPSGGPGG